RLRIRLANWAPEKEYLDQAQLGAVPCEPGYEVDTDAAGRLYVWKEMRPLEMAPVREGLTRGVWTLSLGKPETGRVIVLEFRNTGAFEMAMRQAISRRAGPWPPANLTLRFGNGTNQELQPVGTKFLRRIVVPIPAKARVLQVRTPGNMWWVRRAWLGQGH